MLRPVPVCLIILLSILSCTRSKKIPGENNRNLVYDVGDIPGLDTFKVYNMQEKKMEEVLKRTASDVKKLDKELYDNAPNGKTGNNETSTNLFPFRDNRSRITLKTFENRKLVSKNKPFDESAPALCTCTLQHDSIMIQTSAGFFGGFGFMVKLYSDKFDLKYLDALDADYFKSNPRDSAFTRELIVKSQYQSLVLDSQPTFKRGQQITGFATFTSGKYYSRELGNAVTPYL